MCGNCDSAKNAFERKMVTPGRPGLWLSERVVKERWQTDGGEASSLLHRHRQLLSSFLFITRTHRDAPGGTLKANMQREIDIKLLSFVGVWDPNREYL